MDMKLLCSAKEGVVFMGGVTIQDVLLPQEGQVIWDGLVYGLLFFSLIALFMLSQGSMRDTLMISAVVMFCILDKTYAWGYIVKPDGVYPGMPTDCTVYPKICERDVRVEAHLVHLGTYLMRVLMFSFPLVIAGQTRVGKARVLAALLAVYAGVYSASRWYFQQRSASGAVFMIDWLEPQSIFRSSMLVVGLGALAHRWYRNRFRSIDWETEMLVGGVLASDDTEIEVTQGMDVRP